LTKQAISPHTSVKASNIGVERQRQPLAAAGHVARKRHLLRPDLPEQDRLRVPLKGGADIGKIAGRVADLEQAGRREPVQERPECESFPARGACTPLHVSSAAQQFLFG
jgi:hypothetical protein